jgi:hypothetical protein
MRIIAVDDMASLREPSLLLARLCQINRLRAYRVLRTVHSQRALGGRFGR